MRKFQAEEASFQVLRSQERNLGLTRELWRVYVVGRSRVGSERASTDEYNDVVSQGVCRKRYMTLTPRLVRTN